MAEKKINFGEMGCEGLKQDLTHYYKIIFTLKSGVQIGICSREPYDEDEMVDNNGVIAYYKIKGFTKTPLLVEKYVEISCPEVTAIEQIKDPCIAQVIPWPTLDDITLETPLAADQVEEKNGLLRKKKLTLAEHKSDCAIHNNPPCGFSSEVTSCDCGAIIPCADSSQTDAAGRDRTKRVNPQIGSIEIRNIIMAKQPALSKEDREWKAQQDAQTLAEANVILEDDKRLKAAKKAANKLAKDAADQLAGLLKVAGKLDDTVEGVRIHK